jgi:flagellar FliL protein
MAEQDDIEVVEEKKGNSKLLFIIIGVLLIAIIGLGAMMFLGGGDDAPAEETAKEVKAPKQKPIYKSIDKAFVVNFKDQSGGAVRYLQVKVKVMARSQDVIDAFELHLPAIKHELLLLFFGQTYDVLSTNEGTNAMRQEALIRINKILEREKMPEELEAVYFTSLIMQ